LECKIVNFLVFMMLLPSVEITIAAVMLA